jgi:ABC-type molybdate transport system permease subunit
MRIDDKFFRDCILVPLVVSLNYRGFLLGAVFAGRYAIGQGLKASLGFEVVGAVAGYG